VGRESVVWWKCRGGRWNVFSIHGLDNCTNTVRPYRSLAVTVKMSEMIKKPILSFKVVLILPAVFILLLFTLYPFILNIFYSLHNLTVFNFFDPPFVGLNNYLKILTSSDVFIAVKNTLLYVVASVMIELIGGLALSQLFSQRFAGRGICSVLILSPIALAPAAVGYIFLLLLYDLYGAIPEILGLLGLNISLLGNKNLVLPTMIFIDIWEWTPFMFIILFAGMKSIPQELYEAAKVDGASAWKLFRHITLPLLTPAITVATLFRIIDAFRTFESIYVITGGGPGSASTTLSILVYRNFASGKMGVSAALSVIVFILAFFITQMSNKYLFGRSVGR
jgi:multiple sugar transport system permease protein